MFADDGRTICQFITIGPLSESFDLRNQTAFNPYLLIKDGLKYVF